MKRLLMILALLDTHAKVSSRIRHRIDPADILIRPLADKMPDAHQRVRGVLSGLLPEHRPDDRLLYF